MASHPLIANLFREICAENPELAALVSEVTRVAKEAVAVPRRTTTPGELREEAPQALRRVSRRSAAAEEDKTVEIEVRREVSCPELAQAQSSVLSDKIGPTGGHRR